MLTPTRQRMNDVELFEELALGVPGLAKTLLVSTIAQALRLDFNRIQFTPT
jgi:ATP-dependent Lon protease